MEHIKELLEAFSSRLKSPLWGSVVIALFITNWKAFFFLFFSDTPIPTRFAFFEQNTTWQTIYIYPLIIASVFVLFSPWVSYFFGWAVEVPVRRRRILQDESVHQILLKANKLSVERNNEKALAESRLVQEAKIDQEVQGIENEEVRENLQSQIDTFRKGADIAKSEMTPADPSNEDPDIAIVKQQIGNLEELRERHIESEDWDQASDVDEKITIAHQKIDDIYKSRLSSSK